MSRIVLVMTLAAAAVAAAAGCGGSDGSSDGRTQVVASFYPLAWAAERIGGDSVDVRNLTPAGAEPHDLELSARDVQRIRDADVVLYFGSGFQPAVEDAIEGASGKAVDLLPGGARDPHVWLDPVRFEPVVERIGGALGRPGRGRALARELGRLDGELRRGLANCARRDVVTSHAAFGYLARRYGLEQIPITGLTPETEPSAQDLQRVVADVRDSGATTVFTEKLLSPRLAETVARETGARTAVLDPLEGLTDDELAHGDDYLSVMRRNLAALRAGLGCR